jgi:site-specific recombinase XerD
MWDEKKQISKSKEFGAAQLNRNLEIIRESIKKIIRDGKYLNKNVNLEYVKSQFFKTEGQKEVELNFYSVYDMYTANAKNIKAPKTIQAYNGTLQRIKDFEKEKKFPIDFETISFEFYEKFQNYLINDKSLVNNSVGKHIKTIKSFMNFAVDQGFNTKNFDYKKFKVTKEECDVIYLTEDELLTLDSNEIKSIPLRNVRDNFCFACFTGLRFSDLSKLKPDNIKGDFIHLRTTKTKEILKIPLNEYAKEILDRCSNRGEENKFLPPLPSNQKTNDNLKTIAKDAGITEKITVIKYSGSQKIETEIPKFDLVTTHTARRTFVTLALEKGMRPEMVMKITGHKDYKTFKQYIKLTDLVISNEMNKLWNKGS